jgi:hypothetical protein
LSVGGSLVGDDCAGTIASQGYDILQAVIAGHCTVNGPYSAVDPKLYPLDGGGRTKTHAIGSDSPARDAGNPGGCKDDLAATLATDQCGYGRPYGTACDIDAFEYGERIFADGNEL